MSLPDDSATGEMAFNDLRERILRRELIFPPQVEKLAAVCLARPELLAFERTAAIAAQANVPKSTVTRFVKLLGKTRLKDAREIFRDELRRRAVLSERG